MEVLSRKVQILIALCLIIAQLIIFTPEAKAQPSIISVARSGGTPNYDVTSLSWSWNDLASFNSGQLYTIVNPTVFRNDGIGLKKISLRVTSTVPNSVEYNTSFDVTLKARRIYTDGSKRDLPHNPVTCHIKSADVSETTTTKNTANNGYVTFTIGPLEPGTYEIWFETTYTHDGTTYEAETDIFSITWKTAPTAAAQPTGIQVLILIAILAGVIIVILALVAVLVKGGLSKRSIV